jgi:hypothetical protein
MNHSLEKRAAAKMAKTVTTAKGVFLLLINLMKL